MLVWFEDSLEEVCEGQCNDFPPFLSIPALNINTTFYSNLILEAFPWYCINYPKWGDILLFKVPLNNHHSGIQMDVFSPCMELVLPNDWMVCERSYYQEVKAYVHCGGWWIQCDKHPINMQNVLVSIMAIMC
jgi:hypothetical protein